MVGKENLFQLLFYWTSFLICMVKTFPSLSFCFLHFSFPSLTVFFSLLFSITTVKECCSKPHNSQKDPLCLCWASFCTAQDNLVSNFCSHLKCKLFTLITVVKRLHSCQPENKLFYLKKVNTISVWPVTLETVWRYSGLAHRGTEHAYRNTLKRCSKDLSSAFRALQHFWKSVGPQGFGEHCPQTPKAQLEEFSRYLSV